MCRRAERRKRREGELGADASGVAQRGGRVVAQVREGALKDLLIQVERTRA